MSRFKLIFIPALSLFILFMLFGPMAQAEQSNSQDWRGKVDTELLNFIDQRQSGEIIDFIIRLEQQAVIDVPAKYLGSKETRGTYVYNRLTTTAQQSQAELLKELAAAGAQTRSFYIINAIHVTAEAALIPQIARRTDVAYLHANPAVQLDIQQNLVFPFSETQTPNAIEWGITKIGAPLLWADGFTGNGVTIGGQDTGYHWEHPALKNSYRGWNGSTADHNYNWHDAISTDINGNNSNSRCGFNLTAPCDDISSTHGTHTMGTMVGLDGSNQIGAAPDARWIGCRNMDEGYGTPSTYINCFEWFLAPTDLTDANPDPSKAPHVINNSWGCPPGEGCNTGNFEIMNIVIENLRAAGIVVVVSAGNSGSSCGSVNTPAAIFEGAFAVGATSSNDTIASFSSRGPVSVDGSGRMKPNVSAPGVSVRSSTGNPTSGFSYASYQGTSMAGPHVSGAVGLIISAYPPIAGDVEAIETYLENTADFVGLGNCGGTDAFNNTYGHGRINAHSAAQAIWNLDLHKTVQSTVTVPFSGSITPSGLMTYTISVTKTGEMITFTNTVITDTVPEGATFVSASLPVSVSDQSLTWAVGQMEPGMTKEIAITILLSGTQGTTTTVNFPAAQGFADYVPVQLSNQASTSVNFEEDPGTRFSILRQAPTVPNDDRISLEPNRVTISYTLEITAPAIIPTATNTTVTDTLPAGAALFSTSEPVSTTAEGFVWQLGDMLAGDSEKITVTVQISTTNNRLPAIIFPSAVVAADNTLSSMTPLQFLNPYTYWIPFVGN